VIENAFNAGFHLIAHRDCPVPVGLHMLALFGGKERTVGQFMELTARAGLAVNATQHVANDDLAQQLPLR